MRPSNKSRSRNKSAGNNPQRRSMGNVINRVFESAGPDGKVRGTPQQIIDKYNALARDAQLSGDRVAGENYLQHSEHYSRLLGEAQRQQQEQRQAQDRDDQQPRSDDQQRSDGQSRDDGRQRTDGQQSDGQQSDGQQSDGQRGDERRGDGRRSSERRDDGQRGEGEREQRRQRPDQAASESSGLTTIDPDDGTEDSGPVDTPESRQTAFNGAERAVGQGPHSAPAEAGAPAGQGQAETPAPAKRPRTRKRAKSDSDAEAPASAD